MAGHHPTSHRSENVTYEEEIGQNGKRNAPPSPLQPPSFDPKLSGWNPPHPFRLLHGSFLPELAHRSEIELGPMTLTVGSIFGGRSQTRQKRSLTQHNRVV